MKCYNQFIVKPGSKVKLKDIDPDFKGGMDKKKDGLPSIEKNFDELASLQYLLYAEAKQSLLIVLQALDAGGKDGTIKHVFRGMNPQGCKVAGFKQPTPDESAHDFLWRIHKHTPGRGEVVIFNRSHYEDVLVVRVHDLVPKKIWEKRYDTINDFEEQLVNNGTRILKFFLHISQEEQLERFGARLDNPDKQWKISEGDYDERAYWDKYVSAFDDALEKCSTEHAPWFVIPANHKWFRNLAVSQIVVEALKDMKIKMPEPTVNIEEIRKKYHQAKKAHSS